jgi:thiol-disulfide isomerase/thioredoxin
MAVRSEVEGYDAFCNLIGKLETQGKPVYVYFSGSKGEDGKSWCPDCVKGMFTTCGTFCALTCRCVIMDATLICILKVACSNHQSGIAYSVEVYSGFPLAL